MVDRTGDETGDEAGGVPGGADGETGRETSETERVLELAAAYVSAGRHREALALLGPYLAGHADSERALCLASQAALGSGDPERALRAAERALQLNPENEWSWRLVASALAKLGRFDDAREASSVAQGLAPASWLAHLSLAQVDVFAQCITPDGDAAAIEAVRLAPLEPDAHFMSANVALAKNDLQGAESAYRTTLRLNPQHTAARNNLSVVMLRSGRAADAAGGFLDVLATDPTFALALQNVRAASSNALSRLFRLFAIATTLAGYALVILLLEPPLTEQAQLVVQCSLLLVAVVSAAAVVIDLVRLRRTTGRRLYAYLLHLPRIDRYSTGFVILFVLVYGLMVTACFTALPQSTLLYGACWVLLAVSAAVSGAHDSRRQKSRRPGARHQH
ncbi:MULTISPECIES: tetratricopeptide repeat protein [Subtercola]|uniref:Uncharacterized protein n=1 Tax=Subtercola vilae TaxID=2056433 RepID=A0A4V4RFT9_9MICO|nr:MULTISPECIES: tetratricopeptide repeat protein [Subtercola]MEA9986762.1 tetratricopeptide repeat protein [Subtercola sp. RTI3]TIH34344.1 hypothetical protein D4765_13210 [Subtercola vilae]